MGRGKTVIVAGYGAWAKAVRNPAWHVAEAIGKKDWGSHRVIAVEVPVRSNALLGIIKDTIAAHSPDIWLGFGLASSACDIRLEALGSNWRSFDVPDNDGLELDHEPIIPGGPAAYAATLPIQKIVTACKAAGIPSSLSYSAGNHLCNQMLYTTRHLVETGAAKMDCGFMHLPPPPEMVAAEDTQNKIRPSMCLEMQIRAAEIAMSILLDETDQGHHAGANSVGAST